MKIGAHSDLGGLSAPPLPKPPRPRPRSPPLPLPPSLSPLPALLVEACAFKNAECLVNGDGKKSVLGQRSGVKNLYVCLSAMKVALMKFSRVLVDPVELVKQSSTPAN